MQHQDWEPVVFAKKKAIQQAVTAGQRAVSQLPPKQVRNLLESDGDIVGLKFFEKGYVQAVISKRIELKWSQSDLAQRANVPLNRIQNMERGKEVYDAGLRQKLNRVLQIHGH